MSKTRTFISVAIADDVRERALAAIDLLRSTTDDVKWVAAENLHWTLQFLGDVEDAELADVCRRVTDAVANITAFSLVAEGIGAFPSSQRPRTLWLGAGQGGEAMCCLQSSIEKALVNLGFRGERRRFVPHLTLGRLRRGSRGEEKLVARLAELADFEGGMLAVEEVIVQASYLEHSGPTYHILARTPLV